MGDRIAMLQRRRRAGAVRPPEELLMRPADDFVADFVGADRALKRLSAHARARRRRWSLRGALRRGDADGGRCLARSTRRDARAHRRVERDAARRAADHRSEALVRRGRSTSGARPDLTVDAIGRRLDAERGRGARDPMIAAAGWAPRAVRRRVLPRPRRRRLLRGRQRVLPALGLRTTSTATRTRSCSTSSSSLVDGRRSASSIAFGARARRPPAPLARRAGHAGHRRSSTRSRASRVLPAAAAHGARQRHGDHRARRLHAADPLPQHAGRPGRRARGRARRRPRDGADRAPAALARRAAAGAAGDHGRAADRARRRPSGWRRSRSSPARAASASRCFAEAVQDERRRRGRAVRAAGGRRSTPGRSSLQALHDALDAGGAA